MHDGTESLLRPISTASGRLVRLSCALVAGGAPGRPMKLLGAGTAVAVLLLMVPAAARANVTAQWPSCHWFRRLRIANNISLDYGRSAFDIRHRVFFGGTIGLPYAFRLSPFMIASSGSPYNITTGQDLNGDSIFNDRPAFASPSSIPSNVVTNRFGSFDLVPQPGESLVPVNELTGPERFSLNVRLSKSFGFGKKTEEPRRRRRPGAGGALAAVRVGAAEEAWRRWWRRARRWLRRRQHQPSL